MDERGAFVHRNENHVHVVMGGIYVNTVLLSFAPPRSLLLCVTLTHIQTQVTTTLDSSTLLTPKTNDESHSATKCVNIDEKIHSVPTYTV